MGADQSTQTPNQLAFLSCLQESDYNSNHAFWVSLMSNAGNRNLSTVPDSIFLNNVAAKFPLNFANLVLASIHEICSIQQLPPGTELTPEQLNQLALALQLFISCISVALANPKNSFLLEHLDTDLYNRLKELSKKQLTKDKVSKKAKKNASTEKAETAKATENDNKQEKPKTTKKAEEKPKPESNDKKDDSQNKSAKEDAEEPVFDVKPREVVDINAPRVGKTYDEKPSQNATKPASAKSNKQTKPKTTEKAQSTTAANEKPKTTEKAQPKTANEKPKTTEKAQPTTTASEKPKTTEGAQPTTLASEKPKKKTSAAKRAASPQPSPKTENKTSAANRAKSPQPKRAKKTPEEKAIIAQHRAMRQYDGHVLAAFTNAVIDLLFKKGVTISPTKPHKQKAKAEAKQNEKGDQAEKPKEKKPKKVNKETQEKQEKQEKTDEQPPKETENNNENENVNNDKNNANDKKESKENKSTEENKNLMNQLVDGVWLQSGEVDKLAEINVTRRELIDAILFVSSLHIFYPKFRYSCPEATSLLLDNLPLDKLILSTCRVAFRYMNERPPVTSELSLLLRSSIALHIRLFTNAKFREEISKINPHVFLRAIYTPDFTENENDKKISLPLFDPIDPLSKETLSFLYMIALFQREFVPLLTSKGYSNMFIYNLIWAAQYFFEKENVNYIHSIILSTILLIVVDPKAASHLNRPFKPSTKGLVFISCNFKPSTDKLTFGDLLLEVLLGFCQRDSFLPSLICVFHMISPYVNQFSIATATKMMDLFEHVNANFPNFVPLFLEVFATIVQQKDNKNNGFCPIILSKQALFKNINNDSPSVQKSLPIIQKYLKKARITIKKENKTKLDINEITQILAKIDTEKLFPEPQMFIKHPHIFGGEIEKTWDQWADLIFQLTCEKDVKSIRELRKSLLSNQNSK